MIAQVNSLDLSSCKGRSHHFSFFDVPSNNFKLIISNVNVFVAFGDRNIDESLISYSSFLIFEFNSIWLDFIIMNHFIKNNGQSVSYKICCFDFPLKNELSIDRHERVSIIADYLIVCY